MHVFSSVVDRFVQIKCDLNSSFLLGKYLKVDLFPKTNQEIKLNGLILFFCKGKLIKQQQQMNNFCCENLSPYLHRVCIDFEIRTGFLGDIHLQ